MDQQKWHCFCLSNTLQAQNLRREAFVRAKRICFQGTPAKRDTALPMPLECCKFLWHIWRDSTSCGSEWVDLIPTQHCTPKPKARDRSLCGSKPSSVCQALQAKNDIECSQAKKGPKVLHNTFDMTKVIGINELWITIGGLASTSTSHCAQGERKKLMW